MRILDCHIHAYPPEMTSDPRAWAMEHDESWWADCVAPLNRRGIQGWADIDRLLRDMDTAGVEQAVMLGWYWQQASSCEAQNTWMLQAHRSHPDRLQAFAAVQPAAGDRALAEARRCLEGGMRGIGELHPTVQGFSFRDESFARLVELAVAAKVPFNLHVTDPALSPGPGVCATPLADYVRLAADYPEATFILAHWGGGLPFHELMPRVAAVSANIFYDSAASPLLYDPAVFRRVIDLIGPHRVLLGTDYPLLTYPRETREPAFDRFLADIRSAGLDEAEQRALLGDNLRRLLRLA